MRDKSRNPWWLVLGISGISVIAWFVNTYPPDSIRQIAIFFLLFFLVTYLINFSLLNNVRRAFLLSCFLAILLLLRMLNLREPLYPGLLVITLISLEVLLGSK